MAEASAAMSEVFHERLSRRDESMTYGYEMHAQRYRFAARWCQGKLVLDAGCGVGHGSLILRRSGATEVVGVDISADAVAEATRHVNLDGVRFVQADLERIAGATGVPRGVDTIVNLENIEHLQHPEAFLDGVSTLLKPGGVLVTSSPNGLLTLRDEHGRNVNRFHVKEFTREEFVDLLAPRFREVALYGQWETGDRKVRIALDRVVFEQMCEAYYNPAARVGRILKRLVGARVAPPPSFPNEGATFSWDHVIAPIDEAPYEWQPVVILAVCTR